jgi:hypothetical protein
VYKVAEDGVLRPDFKVFPGFKDFEQYLVEVKEEANYWKGYGPYLEKKIRESGEYDALDDGLELVKKATNLRQSIYNDARLLDGLVGKYQAKAPVDKRGRKMLTPVQMKDMGQEKTKIENRLVLKSFEMAKMREEFLYYLMNVDIDPRMKYSAKVKED